MIAKMIIPRELWCIKILLDISHNLLYCKRQREIIREEIEKNNKDKNRVF